MKKIIICALAIFLSATAFANNQEGIDYYDAGQLKPAKEFFENQVSRASGASLAEALYYLGQIAFDEGKIAEAASLFQRGAQVDPSNVFNRIGEGMVLLQQNNRRAATDIFNAAIRANRRNIDVYIAVARAFLKNGMTTEARENLAVARRYDHRNARLFVLEGDIEAAENNIGAAASAFNQAFTLDPTLKIAYLRYARVYYTINPDLAIERLEQLLAANPNYTIAYRELGEIHYYKGAFQRAIEAYSKYFAEGASVYSMDDQVRYANILFVSKEHAQSLALVQDGLQREPNNFPLSRLKMYNEFELGNFDAATKAANHFFSLGNIEGNRFISLDYVFHSRLMTALENTPAAIESLKKALEIDPNNADLYKQIAEAYRSLGNFESGIPFYREFIERSGDRLQSLDFFNFGQYLYSAATNITNENGATTPELTAKRNDLLTQADAQFAIVQERSPNSHLGALWRARSQAQIDRSSELGLAKPHFESVVSILTSGEGELTSARQRDLIEAYSYLGYYYYSQRMFEESRGFWNRILALDPTNEQAIRAQQLPGIR